MTRRVRSTILLIFPLGGTVSPYLIGCTSYMAWESSISAKSVAISSTRVGGALSSFPELDSTLVVPVLCHLVVRHFQT